jgi:hypothetical protein
LRRTPICKMRVIIVGWDCIAYLLRTVFALADFTQQSP